MSCDGRAVQSVSCPKLEVFGLTLSLGGCYKKNFEFFASHTAVWGNQVPALEGSLDHKHRYLTVVAKKLTKLTTYPANTPASHAFLISLIARLLMSCAKSTQLRFRILWHFINFKTRYLRLTDYFGILDYYDERASRKFSIIFLLYPFNSYIEFHIKQHYFIAERSNEKFHRL